MMMDGTFMNMPFQFVGLILFYFILKKMECGVWDWYSTGHQLRLDVCLCASYRPSLVYYCKKKIYIMIIIGPYKKKK